uniref:Nuclear receptor domain-containing protein n=1 Tax=Caenorhabditis tropicalis TaxID=1561998 RepID=A0A1I7SZM1_9PELO
MEPSTSEGFPSRRKAEKANCAICDDIGDGCHFGAEACRACAAFFRRTVALGKEYECRQGQENCTVNKIVRTICKSCRLNKCLEVGMNPRSVQSKQNKKERQSPPAMEEESSVTSLGGMPILERMKMSYERLEKSRNVIHRKDGDNIFEKRIPRSLKFQESLDQASKEINLLADWIEWCFDEFHTLATIPTICCSKRCPPQSIAHRKIESIDFFALTVLLFWDHGLVGQSEECMSLSRRMKSAVAKEYIHYQKYFKGEEDPAAEMAVKVSILTCLQRVSNRFREDMSLAHVFDVYTIPENVINTFVGRYS